MKILLDECLPKKLKRSLEEHTVITVPEQGWSGTKNGELLGLAENEFDVFLTVDRNLTYQQNLTNVNLAIVVLVAGSNRLESLMPLMPEVRLVLETIQAGNVVRIGELTG
jgi:predicted nuclease of predicted toxin-antitoxin system